MIDANHSSQSSAGTGAAIKHGSSNSTAHKLRDVANLGRSIRRSMWLFVLAGSFLCGQPLIHPCSAASLTLTWDTVANTTGYRVYQATGTAPFSIVLTTATPTATLPEGTNTTRFYVTAYNANGESPPSATVTNIPPTLPPGTPLVTIFAPALGTTNVAVGSTVSVSARIQNDGTADYAIIAGNLTLLAPGATRQDGPYIYVANLPPQTVRAGTAVSVSGTWTATNAVTGTWTAYLVVQDASSTWTAGPSTMFTVSTTVPQLPSIPQNLRLQKISNSRIDLSWQNLAAYGTKIEQSKNGGGYVQIASVAPGIYHCTASVSKHTDYFFRARAFSADGYSDFSNSLYYHSQ